MARFYSLSPEERKAELELQNRQRLAGAEIDGAEQTLLMEELAEAGFPVDSVSGLFNRKEPWRKDIPIRDWAPVVPILLRHLTLPYAGSTRASIASALTHKKARFAFDTLVGVLRESLANRDGEIARSIAFYRDDPRNLYTDQDLHRYVPRWWDDYRFSLLNAISYLFQKEHLEVVRELVLDDRLEDDRIVLIDELRRKFRRWRRQPDAALTSALKSVARDDSHAGKAAKKTLAVLFPE